VLFDAVPLAEHWVGAYDKRVRTHWTKLSVSFCLALISGCASKGSLEDRQSPKVSLGASRSFQLRVVTSDPELRSLIPAVEKSFRMALPAKNFAPGSRSGADWFEVTILGYDKGSAGKRALKMGGEAEIQLLIKATENQSNTALLEWVVKGNSSRSGRLSVGGVDTALFDDTAARAADAAAKIVAGKLAKHF